MKAQINLAILGLVFGAAALGVSQLQAEGASPAPAAHTPTRGEEWAEGPGDGPEGQPHRGRRMGRIGQRLGLSKEQLERGRALHAAMREKVKPVMGQLQDKHAELELLWRAPSPDRAAILAKMSELDQLHQKMREARVDFRMAMQLVLTPVQRIKAEELLRRPRGRPGMGPRFSDGPGFPGGE